MKGFSIRQPWAWLVAAGHKPIENRDWTPRNPNLRFRGDFLIHAGQAVDRSAMELVQMGRHPVTGIRLPFEPPSEFALGGIVGAASVSGVVTAHDSDYFVGPYGLVVSNARELPFVSCKGQLGFFNVPADVLAQIGELQ